MARRRSPPRAATGRRRGPPLLLALLLAACGRPPSAAPPGAATPTSAAAEEPAPPAEAAPASPTVDEPWAGLPAPTLDELMVGSCSVDGTPGLVADDGELPPVGAELWLATAAGVVPGVVSARGGCDDEELAEAAKPDADVECPTPWAEVEVETDDGELPCARGWGRDWPDVLVDVPAPDVVVAVPRTRAPPRIPAQRLELHLLDGRCEGHEIDASGEERDVIVTVSDREWPLAATLDALLPELVGAPRRVVTLAADGEPPLHAVAATLDDRTPKARARWALLRGAAPADLRLLTTREEPHPKRRLALEHLLDHTCRTPFMFAPTPALLLRLGPTDAPLLLTADERPGETIRFELWAVDDAGAKLRHRFPSELFSPKF